MHGLWIKNKMNGDNIEMESDSTVIVIGAEMLDCDLQFAWLIFFLKGIICLVYSKSKV